MTLSTEIYTQLIKKGQVLNQEIRQKLSSMPSYTELEMLKLEASFWGGATTAAPPIPKLSPRGSSDAIDDGSGRSAFARADSSGGLVKKASRFLGPDLPGPMEGIAEKDMDCISLKSGNWTLSLKLTDEGGLGEDSKGTAREEKVFCGYLYKKSGTRIESRCSARYEDRPS